MSTILRAFFTRRMLSVFFLGVSSGLPLLLLGSTFKTWMTELHISLATVGAFALVQLPYSFKFLWAPLMDRFVPPFLGRRRGWILISQILLMLGLIALGQIDPATNLRLAVVLCLCIAFFSASQDIAIDAYRREILTDQEQGLGSSMGVNGYRVGLLIAGAGALAIAQLWGWPAAYWAMGMTMGLAMVFTLVAPDEGDKALAPKTLNEAVVQPFKQFIARPAALEILAFVLLFKIGDQMASDMFNPFYIQIGYSKIDIAAISKVFGLWATILGGVLGGIALLRFDMFKCLWVFGLLQAVSTLGFSWLALMPPSLVALGVVVTFENVASGLGGTAYVAFMSLLTDRRFTATQYALLSSLMSVPRVIFGSSSGVIAEKIGWPGYFIFCAAVAVPGLLLLTRSGRWAASPSSSTRRT